MARVGCAGGRGDLERPRRVAVDAPIDVAMARAAHRTIAREDASDADASITAAVAGRFAAWPEAYPLDTTKAATDVTREALSQVGQT